MIYVPLHPYLIELVLSNPFLLLDSCHEGLGRGRLRSKFGINTYSCNSQTIVQWPLLVRISSLNVRFNRLTRSRLRPSSKAVCLPDLLSFIADIGFSSAWDLLELRLSMHEAVIDTCKATKCAIFLFTDLVDTATTTTSSFARLIHFFAHSSDRALHGCALRDHAWVLNS